jgi:hypothetical protein
MQSRRQTLRWSRPSDDARPRRVRATASGARGCREARAPHACRDATRVSPRAPRRRMRPRRRRRPVAPRPPRAQTHPTRRIARGRRPDRPPPDSPPATDVRTRARQQRRQGPGVAALGPAIDCWQRATSSVPGWPPPMNDIRRSRPAVTPKSTHAVATRPRVIGSVGAVAVLPEDFERFDLLPLQPKKDPNLRRFLAQGYHNCTELDAIPAPALRDLVRAAIEQHAPGRRVGAAATGRSAGEEERRAPVPQRHK